MDSFGYITLLIALLVFLFPFGVALGEITKDLDEGQVYSNAQKAGALFILCIYIAMSLIAPILAYMAELSMFWVFVVALYHPAWGVIRSWGNLSENSELYNRFPIWFKGGTIYACCIMLIPIFYLLGGLWYVCGGFLCFEDQPMGTIIIDFILSTIALLYVLATLVLIFKR